MLTGFRPRGGREIIADIALLILLLTTAAAGSVALTPLLLASPPAGLELVETTVGTTFFCAGIAMLFHRYGVATGSAALVLSWFANRAYSSRAPQVDRLCAWGSAAAFLAFLGQA